MSATAGDRAVTDRVAPVTLDEMFAAELAQIRMRRAWLAGEGAVPSVPATGPGPARPDAVAAPASEVKIAAAGRSEAMDLAGLALSGGGIRSAAFCLGALQAMNRSGVFERFDYLSTVSGGGYIGAALSATCCAARGGFAFDRVQGRQGDAAAPRDIDDNRVVRHLRNYSNFLVPHGFLDWVTSAALVLRGIVTNAVVMAFWLLFFAAVTLAWNPLRASLARFGPQVLEHRLAPLLPGGGFYLWPLGVGLLLVLYFLGWSLLRSATRYGLGSEFRGAMARVGGGLLIALALCLALSAQGDLLYWLTAADPGTAGKAAADDPGFLTLVGSAFLASPAIVFLVGTFGDRLAKLASEEATAMVQKLAKYASRLALLAGALALPALLWLAYLFLVYSGLQMAGGEQNWLLRAQPGWLPDAGDHAAALTLGLFALVVLVPILPLQPNAYSLHRLYRDRLSRAFVIHPTDEGRRADDLRMLYNLRLSMLRCVPRGGGEPFVHGPFPLMNTALNVQGSATVNRRGRNADFFVFTPLHAGSPATGYVPVEALEACDPTLDLAAVMAISGAAASSNMGSSTIRPLSTTLALLNVRLGYWLANPRRIVAGRRPGRDFFPWLWKEMTSQLDETLGHVLLTDGGHIENLGIYELLRRRCRLIVAVDAEADPQLTFASFVRLQRYARIDLGIRIDLPWPDIAAATRPVMAANAGKGETPPPAKGPHAALGTVHYDDGTSGFLLYLKSSLTGDENDYVRDYARRNPSFPHETTADQFFSEEQFEAYRALGFHVAFGALAGDAAVAMTEGPGFRLTDRFGKAGDPPTAAERVAAMLSL